MAASYEQRVRFDADPDDILDAFADAMDDRRAIDVRLSRKRRQVTARTRLNFWCWRERIEVRVWEDGEAVVRSTCVIPTQVFDYRKNERNVRELVEDVADEFGEWTGRRKRRAAASVIGETDRSSEPLDSKLSRSGRVVYLTAFVILSLFWVVAVSENIGPGPALKQALGGRGRLAVILAALASAFLIAFPLAFLWDLITGQGMFARRREADDED